MKDLSVYTERSTPDSVVRRCILEKDTWYQFLCYGLEVYPSWWPSLTKYAQKHRSLLDW